MASSSNARNCTEREIIYEPDFVHRSFKDKLFCNEGLAILNIPPLKALFKLPKRAYPRLVRAFYQTFRTESNEEDRTLLCHVKIDNVDYQFTLHDIAATLGIRPYEPMVYRKHSMDLINELNIYPRDENVGKIVRASALHENMWLVDYVLFSLLCPVTHAQERPQYLLKYWHGLFKGKGIDVPALMVDMMEKVIVGGRSNKNPHKLIYPRIISSLLLRLGYKVRGVEEVIEEFPVLEHNVTLERRFQTWARKHELLPPARDERLEEIRQARKDAKAAADAQAQAELDAEAAFQQELETAVPYSQTRLQQPHIISQAEYESWRAQTEQTSTRIQGLHDRFDGLEEDVYSMGHRMEEVYHMQRLSLERSWGDTLANEMYTEAQTRAEGSHPRRRTRRRPTPREQNEDVPMD